MSRFSQLVPKSEHEIERFYLDLIEKMKGANSTLGDVEQNSTRSGSYISGEVERILRDLVKATVAPLKAQISELERQIRTSQTSPIRNLLSEIEREYRLPSTTSLSSKVDDLERRIDSMERSARF